MRLTAQMNQLSSYNALSRTYGSGVRAMNQIYAERQVLDLQDNPTASLVGLKMKSMISQTEQYMNNISMAVSSLDLTTAHMSSMKGSLDSVMSLLIGAADSSMTAAERQTASYEVNTLLQQLLQMANAKDGSRYLFGGTNSGSEPFTAMGKYVLYTGNSKYINYQTGSGTTSAINATGTDAFGNLTTTISTDDLNPGINLGTDTSTPLSALNGGTGVPTGSIMVYYSAYPNGLEVSLAGCSTLEDVKNTIERATLEASRNLDPETCDWLDGSTLDWKDLTDRYVEVSLNPDGNGLSLREVDLGEPLPALTAKEIAQGLNYSGAPGFTAGGGGSGSAAGAVYSALRVDDFAGNKVATLLGIKGTASTPADPTNPDSKVDGYIHGTDLNPVITGSTLLADLDGYNDGVYTISNGDKAGTVSIRETSDDVGNVFSNWNLNNLTQGYNTGSNGDLYVRVTRRDPPDDDIYVEVYAVPLDQAKASDLVATGTTTNAEGGTVVLTEANSSGVSGSVSILLPTTVDEASVDLVVEWADNLQGSVYVPAFVEETENGVSKDYLNLLSGWNITGLTKPPASGYQPASTDLDGNISVNIRIDGDKVILELYRPAYDNEPAVLIATGEMDIGSPPRETAVSGRIAITGVEGFEDIGGSVYFELPAEYEFDDGVLGTDANNPTGIAYGITSPLAANTTFTIGGAMTLKADQTLNIDLVLQEDTVFKAGQTFSQDVTLPNGFVLPAGTPLAEDTLIRKGTTIPANTTILEGTTLPAGSVLEFQEDLVAGTIVPAGSYTHNGAGFPAEGMMSSDAAHAGQAMGFNVQATFATVEDFMRAVEELGIYVTAGISDDGTAIEFRSQLAGAYLTVSEDTDCYEQLGDTYQQLSALDLNGLVKGVNTDANGDLHTEVIYYPPDPNRTDGKVALVSDDGEILLIDAGYYVRVYSDSEALNQAYEDRDNSTLVAEGFIAAGDWDGTDPLNPYIPTTVGTAYPLVLEERNGSGITGTVNFDYYGGRDQVDASGLEEDYSPYNNAKITISPGGLRTTSSVHTTIQEIDIAGFTPGVHCDYSGTAHATISYEDGPPATTTVAVYRDASRSHMSAKGELNAATGEVILYETDKNGDYLLDADGNRIPVGSMVIADNQLSDGQSDNFTITMGGLGASGQDRESDVFSTLADILGAMNANDLDDLHARIDVVQAGMGR
ncbi:MAG: hypothetical protein LIP77_12255, partial [Planctomycetes bacterium]|nr:hypothetical protein [Planctomycetota bacterium]